MDVVNVYWTPTSGWDCKAYVLFNYKFKKKSVIVVDRFKKNSHINIDEK